MKNLINISYLKENFGDDEAFLKEMLATMAEELPNRMESLGQAVNKDQPEAAREAAHSMKSPLQMLGLDDLLAKIKTIEDAGKAGESMAHYKDLMMQANAQFEQVRKELNELI